MARYYRNWKCDKCDKISSIEDKAHICAEYGNDFIFCIDCAIKIDTQFAMKNMERLIVAAKELIRKEKIKEILGG